VMQSTSTTLTSRSFRQLCGKQRSTAAKASRRTLRPQTPVTHECAK
jgi:hypothetical protein